MAMRIERHFSTLFNSRLSIDMPKVLQCLTRYIVLLYFLKRFLITLFRHTKWDSL